MHRSLLIAILILLGMVWLGVRVRKSNQLLATALFTAATVISLLILGAVTGLIGG